MLLEAEPAPASSHANLYFVEHEERVIFSAKAFGFFKEFCGEWVDPAFTHDGLHEDCGGFVAEYFSEFV
jgi:hypothetical protein